MACFLPHRVRALIRYYDERIILLARLCRRRRDQALRELFGVLARLIRRLVNVHGTDVRHARHHLIIINVPRPAIHCRAMLTTTRHVSTSYRSSPQSDG